MTSSEAWSSTCGFFRKKSLLQQNSNDHGSSFRNSNCRPQKSSPILHVIALIFSRKPFLVLFVTLGLSTILAKVGISEFGYPEFEDPYVGFETRKTEIGDRLITLENLRKEINKLGIIENYPGEKLSGREFRRRRRKREEDELHLEYEFEEPLDEDDRGDFLGGGYCSKSPLDDYSKVALEIEKGKDVFSYEILMLICYFQKLTEVLPEYERVCEHDGKDNCCPMWSLPNYVTEFANISDCSNLKEAHVQQFLTSMKICHSLFNDSIQLEWCSLKHKHCPEMCHQDKSIYSSTFSVIDRGFFDNKKVKFTMITLPIPKNRGYRFRTGALQSALINIALPDKGVSVAGFDFGDKDWVFKQYLMSDLKYVMAGSVLIFVIVICYTKSFSVTVISFLTLVLSLGVSYFLYNAVFRIPYFPFMNMLVTIIVMGIGTDATLILGSEWQRLKSRYKEPDQETWTKMMELLLQETTIPLIVTTCTTAGAFFASLTSSVTTIKCFSIFAGTSIIVGFIMLYLCVPTTLLLSDMCMHYLTLLFTPDNDESLLNAESSQAQNGNKIITMISKVVKVVISVKSCSTVAVTGNFAKYLKSQGTLLWIVAFLSLLSVLVWSCFIVFYKPGFQLPNSEQFQLLSKDHPIERYDREIEPLFEAFTSMGTSSNEIVEEPMTIYLIWGVLPADTGNSLDPNDNGRLEFDKSFSLSNPKNQKWMRKLCSKLKKQRFYDETSNTVVGAHYDACFMDTMVKWMKRDCQQAFTKKSLNYEPCCKTSKFPYESDVFSHCLEEAARDVYRTPTPYFQPDVAGPKFFVLEDKLDNSSSIDLKRDSGHLATFSLRVRTNYTYSLSYDKMKQFYEEVNAFYQAEVKDKVPLGLENGFFISAHLDFFDLQHNLISDTCTSVLISAGLCFGFLWIFSRNFLIAIGGVLCIIAVVVVSSSLLISVFSWRLGVFESIAVTVAVGLSDFTAHHALEYSKRKCVLRMTKPTFFSAVTTLIIGLAMLLFSNVLVYQQIGAFFTVLIAVSWTYSVFFLSPVLDLFDRVQDLCSAVKRLYFVDSFSNERPVPPDDPNNEVVDGSNSVVISDNDSAVINATVISNPLAGSTTSSMIDVRVEEKQRRGGTKARRESENDGMMSRTRSPSSRSLSPRSPTTTTTTTTEDTEQGAIVEKMKLLKKVAAETSV